MMYSSYSVRYSEQSDDRLIFVKTIIVWYRNDLRVHDHPALAKAVEEADMVVPLFIFDPKIVRGKHAGSNRNRFLLESLNDLKKSLKKIGGDLVIRNGDVSTELKKIINELHADAVFYTADYSPYAIRRDKSIHEEHTDGSVEIRAFPGRLIVSTVGKIATKSGTPHKVFTPFWNAWQQVGRRDIAQIPKQIQLPSGCKVGQLPVLKDITTKKDLSPQVLTGGETEARRRLAAFLDSDIHDYYNSSNDMAVGKTSRLSAYLHFGCISPLEIESRLPNSQGARAWHRQLAWREFYHFILLKNPTNSKQEFQDKYRKLRWEKNDELFYAWQQGKTGYPAVDAAMRQLNHEGWMHNRGRLIVGSFLTKDLWLDWRFGETYFMQMLIDGDQANNNGNWQWIASVGVDPAPVYRRLYNPSSQRDKFDPTGEYVRRYIPELQNVPDKYLSEPWTMPDNVQQESGCIIGEDYPVPIVNHKQAREFALEQYRLA